MKSLLLYVAFVMCLVNWGCGHREVKEEKFVIEGEVENCNTFMKVAVVDIEKGKERVNHSIEWYVSIGREGGRIRDGRIAFSQGYG